MTSGTIFIVTAPSGAGKTTLVSALRAADPSIHLSISHTTRQPRTGEIDGQHYHFVSHAAFEEALAQGEFLEHAQVYGYYYGTSRTGLQAQLAAGRDILLEIDVQGAAQVAAVFPEAVRIFILPPSLSVLKARLTGRGTDAPEVIARRLAAAQSEMAQAGQFDYLIVNDDLTTAAADLIAVVRAARLKTARQAQAFPHLFQECSIQLP